MALSKEDLQAIRDIMQEETSPLKEDLKRLNETVAKIENIHGYKLGVLFDAQVDYSRTTQDMRQVAANV